MSHMDLYCLYTKYVSDNIQRFLLHHLYDTQLYIAIYHKYLFLIIIKLMMQCNMLKLNDDKTEFIVFKFKSNTSLFAGVSVQVGNTSVGVTVG